MQAALGYLPSTRGKSLRVALVRATGAQPVLHADDAACAQEPRTHASQHRRRSTRPMCTAAHAAGPPGSATEHLTGAGLSVHARARRPPPAREEEPAGQEQASYSCWRGSGGMSTGPSAAAYRYLARRIDTCKQIRGSHSPAGAGIHANQQRWCSGVRLHAHASPTGGWASCASQAAKPLR
jgi:hypothetical protein